MTTEMIFRIIEMVIIVPLISFAGWALNRLINRVDSVSKLVTEALPAQALQIQHLEKQINELARDFRDIIDIKVAVAVMQKEIDDLKASK